MRILMNAQCLAPPMTGVGHYARRIALGLDAAEDTELICFRDHKLVAPPAPEGIPDFDAALPPRLKPVPRGERLLREAVKAVPGVVPAYLALKDRQQRQQLRGIRDALYFEPNHIPLPLDHPSVVTVHDLSTLHHPDWHPEERIRYFREGWPRVAERAAHIVAVSDFTRRDVIETLGVPAERVTAIPNGVAPSFRPRPYETLEPNLAALGLLPGRYLLSVATVEPRKNLKTLVAAYLRLPEALRLAYPLVLAGSRGWGDPGFREQLAGLDADGRVRLLGYVPDAHLPLLYAGARAIAYLSLYEGFGLPVAEGLASGVPVLTSRDTVMQEIAGDAAHLIEPRDVEAATEALRALLEDESLRARLSEAGPQQVAAYSWDRAVAAHLALFRALAPA